MSLQIGEKSPHIVQDFGNSNKGVIGDHNHIGSIVHAESGQSEYFAFQAFDWKEFAEGPAIASGGVFYAYIHNRRDDNTWRMIIIFSSREVADEWWRAVSTSQLSQLKGNIQRITPQFYNHSPDQWNFINFFTDSHVKSVADKFRGKMFIVLENDRGGRGITIIPLQCIVDRTSGSSFCIQSKSDPQQYWDIDARGRVYVSSKSRASFVVSARNVDKKAIMIGSDEVTLSTSCGPVFLHKQPNSATFSFVEAGESAKAYEFKLKDLEDGKFFVGEGGFVCFADQGKSGVAWELTV